MTIIHQHLNRNGYLTLLSEMIISRAPPNARKQNEQVKFKMALPVIELCRKVYEHNGIFKIITTLVFLRYINSNFFNFFLSTSYN